jgi:hypothetical protein
MKLDLDLLNWFGNLINFLIFIYISIGIINTQCFNLFQMSLTLIGILASIIIQVITLTIKQNLKS